jgi:hypothetical protein
MIGYEFSSTCLNHTRKERNMQREEIRKIVTAQFYQSLAESGQQIDALPQAQLQAIINAMADGLVAALIALEDEEVQAVAPDSPSVSAPATVDNGEERLLWRGRPYLSIGIRYELTTQRLRIIRGLLGHNLEEIELVRIRDTNITQHVGERALNVGDIKILSNDPSHPEVMLHNVRNPVEVRELIRNTSMEEKKRRNLYYREEM